MGCSRAATTAPPCPSPPPRCSSHLEGLQVLLAGDLAVVLGLEAHLEVEAEAAADLAAVGEAELVRPGVLARERELAAGGVLLLVLHLVRRTEHLSRRSAGVRRAGEAAIEGSPARAPPTGRRWLGAGTSPAPRTRPRSLLGAAGGSGQDADNSGVRSSGSRRCTRSAGRSHLDGDAGRRVGQRIDDGEVAHREGVLGDELAQALSKTKPRGGHWSAPCGVCDRALCRAASLQAA